MSTLTLLRRVNWTPECYIGMREFSVGTICCGTSISTYLVPARVHYHFLDIVSQCAGYPQDSTGTRFASIIGTSSGNTQHGRGVMHRVKGMGGANRRLLV